MGNALYINWSDTQQHLFSLQFHSSLAVSAAFGTVLTHHCVSEWILSSNKNKRKDPHDNNAPVFIISCLVFWVLYTLVFNFNVLASGTVSGKPPGAAYYVIATPTVAIFGFVLNILFSWLWKTVIGIGVGVSNETFESSEQYTSPLLEDDTASAVHSNIDAQDTILEDTTTTTASPTPRATVEYINNIKIFLTNMIIIQHCYAQLLLYFFDIGQSTGQWDVDLNLYSNQDWGYVLVFEVFLTTNRGYIMSLFFFYSGYFVPKSYDKKGRYSFLFDRVKRLGIPFVLFTFLIGPYIVFGFNDLLLDTGWPAKLIVYSSVTWFLNQLLIYNIIYAYACGENWNPKVNCPSLLGFFLVSLLIGLLTFVVSLFFPTMLANRMCNSCNSPLSFFGIPYFGSDFPSFPIYFFAGSLAQRNNWMKDIKEKSRVAIYAWAATSILLSTSLWYYEDKLPTVVALLIFAIIRRGIMSIGVCLAVSVFFMDYMNRKYFFTAFFTKAMYTAYLIQFVFPVQFGVKCGLLVMEWTGNIAYTDDGSPYISDNMVFLAWLLMSAIALIIGWPLAYAIRSIPGFSQVL